MINLRTGFALLLVIAIMGLAVGLAALFGNIRDDGPAQGRLLQTRVTNRLSGDPVAFLLDDLYMSSDGTGHVRALYAYPPGFFGANRGCKVVWQAQAQALAAGKSYGPGLFTDPCSGAHFDRTGALIDGPADRDLDYFPMTPEPDGFLVDTRTLLCGDIPAPDTGSATPAATATPTPSSPARCDRVRANTN